MKRTLAILLTLALITALAACGTSREETTDSSQSTAATHPQADETAQPSTDRDNETSGQTNAKTQPMRIKLTVNDKTATVRLLDNDAAADFFSMLPLTVTFEDYNGIEKIATLPRELVLGASPTRSDPDAGSFAYYVPWGNLSVFYNDFRESESLVPLGTFESGIEAFAEMSGDFSVTIEPEENQ